MFLIKLSYNLGILRNLRKLEAHLIKSWQTRIYLRLKLGFLKKFWAWTQNPNSYLKQKKVYNVYIVSRCFDKVFKAQKCHDGNCMAVIELGVE